MTYAYINNCSVKIDPNNQGITLYELFVTVDYTAAGYGNKVNGVAAASIMAQVADWCTVRTAQSLKAGVQSFGYHTQMAEEHLYDHYRKKGMTHEAALGRASVESVAPSLVAGAITSTLVSATGRFFGYGAEAFGTTLSRKELAKATADGAWKTVGKGALGEMVEETSDEMAQGMIELATWNPEKTGEEIVMGGIIAGLVGGVLGGGVTTLSAGKQSLYQTASLEHARQSKYREYYEAVKTKLGVGTEATAAALEARATGVETAVEPAAMAEAGSERAATSAGVEIIEGGFDEQEKGKFDWDKPPALGTEPAPAVETTPTIEAEPSLELDHPFSRATVESKAKDAINEGTITAEDINNLTPDGKRGKQKAFSSKQISELIAAKKAEAADIKARRTTLPAPGTEAHAEMQEEVETKRAEAEGKAEKKAEQKEVRSRLERSLTPANEVEELNRDIERLEHEVETKEDLLSDAKKNIGQRLKPTGLGWRTT